MNTKKLLIIGKYFDPFKGGIETVTSFQRNILNSYIGTKVDFIFFSNLNSSKKGYFFFKYFNIFSQPISFSIFFWLKKNLHNYELVEIHTPNPLIMVYINLLSNFKTKLIIHYHSDIVNQKFLLQLFNSQIIKCLNNSHYIISTSHKYYKNSSYLKDLKKKIIVIPPVIDENKFTYKNNHNKSEGLFNLLSVGRFVEYKGFEYLIESMRFLPKNFKLTLIGNGKLYDKYIRLIKKFNLFESVKIKNDLSDQKLNDEYLNCNLFILPSINKSEAFGIVLLEALYLGKPLLTANLDDSGVTEINDNKITGIYFNKKDPLDLSRKIIKMYNLISKNCFNENNLREYYTNKFSRKHIELQYLKLYDLKNLD